jgi:hypothetical protein
LTISQFDNSRSLFQNRTDAAVAIHNV